MRLGQLVPVDPHGSRFRINSLKKAAEVLPRRQHDVLPGGYALDHGTFRSKGTVSHGLWRGAGVDRFR